MSFSSKNARFILIGVSLVAGSALLYNMGKWIIPFLLATIFAYALHVPVRKLAKSLRLSPTVSSGIVVTVLIAFFCLFVIFFIPVFKNAMFVIVQKIPSLLHSLPLSINSILSKATSMFGIERQFNVEYNINEYINGLTSVWPKYISQLINTSVAMMHSVIFIIMTPIILYYLLRDWDKISVAFEHYLSKISSKTVVIALKLINTNLGTYVKGQFLVCCILSIVYTLSLYFLNLEEYIICGIFSGFLSFAPFFGPVLGLLMAATMGVDDFSCKQYLLTVCLYVTVPLIDSNFLTPKLIGKSIGIHPIWLLFLICAATSVLGTAGIFISIPIAVTLSTICKEFLRRYN
jgi:predicted PurR-regulated permease PerM